MSSLQHESITVETPSCVRIVPDPEPHIPPREDERDMVASWTAPRPEPPDPRDCLPASDWLEARAAWHRLQAAKGPAWDPRGAHALVAGQLAQLARTLRGERAAAVLRRDRPASVPASYMFESPLAGQIAYEAGMLYPCDSAVKRIAARALVHLALDVERFGSDTAEEYLVDEAAWRAAMDDSVEGEPPV